MILVHSFQLRRTLRNSRASIIAFRAGIALATLEHPSSQQTNMKMTTLHRSHAKKRSRATCNSSADRSVMQRPSLRTISYACVSSLLLLAPSSSHAFSSVKLPPSSVTVTPSLSPRTTTTTIRKATQLSAWSPFANWPPKRDRHNQQTPQSTGQAKNQNPFLVTSNKSFLQLESTNGVDEETQTLLDEIGAMRVREIKTELKSLGLGSEDIFEKRDLVHRLVKARQNGVVCTDTVTGKSRLSGPPTAAGTSSPKKHGVNASSAAPGAELPLTFYGLESFRSVEADNTDQAVFVRPSPGHFACIQAELPYRGKLTLLVDTACTGLVLRPSSAQRLKIPTFKNTFGTMAAAGGNVANTAVAQLESLKVGKLLTGAMPAAVQDIGALPAPIDGIIGLTFLSEFATVDMCFDVGRLMLYKRSLSPPGPQKKGLVEVAKTTMKRTPLGIYTADVMLDGKGPVTMLVDTGAASTVLNWRGLRQMGLDRTSPEVGPTPEDIGAIGADNVALRLTHRYSLKDGFGLVDSASDGSALPGIMLKGGSTVNLDIGDIPVLDTLSSSNVGGILGADLLMRSDFLRINLKGPTKGRFILYGKPEASSPSQVAETAAEAKEPTAAAAAAAAATTYSATPTPTASSNGSAEPPKRKKKKKVRSD